MYGREIAPRARTHGVQPDDPAAVGRREVDVPGGVRPHGRHEGGLRITDFAGPPVRENHVHSRVRSDGGIHRAVRADEHGKNVFAVRLQQLAHCPVDCNPQHLRFRRGADEHVASCIRPDALHRSLLDFTDRLRLSARGHCVHFPQRGRADVDGIVGPDRERRDIAVGGCEREGRFAFGRDAIEPPFRPGGGPDAPAARCGQTPYALRVQAGEQLGLLACADPVDCAAWNCCCVHRAIARNGDRLDRSVVRLQDQGRAPVSARPPKTAIRPRASVD